MKADSRAPHETHAPRSEACGTRVSEGVHAKPCDTACPSGAARPEMRQKPSAPLADSWPSHADRHGVAVAGCAVTDVIMSIKEYPQRGALENIERVQLACGGAVCNVLSDLDALDAHIPLFGIAVMGEDANGQCAYDAVARTRADLSRVRREGRGSFTDVMQDSACHSRTFFHYKGANALLEPDDFKLDTLPARFLYVGYPLLLDALDAPDPECGTRLARVLQEARARGMRTCLDFVTVPGAEYACVAAPVLPHTDILCLNEEEASSLTGIPVRAAQGELEFPAMLRALGALIRMGVQAWAVIHAPEGSAGMTVRGETHVMHSPKLPEGFIQGTVGAGDAFFAGLLTAAHRKRSLQDALECAQAAACQSLRAPDAVSAMCSLEDALSAYRALSVR